MHLDGNPENCALRNLALGTVSQNNLMKTSFGKNKLGNTAVPVVAISNEGKTETRFKSMYDCARTLGLCSSTIGKILDTRPRNRYYKNTYDCNAKKFTFRKDVVLSQ